MTYGFKDKKPDIDKASFIAPSADIVGDVVLGEDSSVWFNTTIRADVAPIRIGRGTNIQDNCVIHADEDAPATIGDHVTVGHNATLHGCTVGNGSLIGMGAIILNNTKIGNESVVGAGVVVSENKQFPDRSLIVGSPAKVFITLREKDLERVRDAAASYLKKAVHMKKSISE